MEDPPIFVRKALQEGKGGKLTQETWDQPLKQSQRRSHTAFWRICAAWTGEILQEPHTSWLERNPWGITFSDGNDRTYMALMYLRWETSQGPVVRFVYSKAKPTPLYQKGEAVKVGLCGAVFTSRIRKYVGKHARMRIERWFHLHDSQTVLGAIQRDSYGYNTFFANRLGEIQKAGPVQDWWWGLWRFEYSWHNKRGHSWRLWKRVPYGKMDQSSWNGLWRSGL